MAINETCLKNYILGTEQTCEFRSAKKHFMSPPSVLDSIKL